MALVAIWFYMPLKADWKPNKRIAQGKRSDTLRIIVLSLVRPERAKALITQVSDLDFEFEFIA